MVKQIHNISGGTRHLAVKIVRRTSYQSQWKIGRDKQATPTSRDLFKG